MAEWPGCVCTADLDSKKSQTQQSCIGHHPGKQDAWGYLLCLWRSTWRGEPSLENNGVPNFPHPKKTPAMLSLMEWKAKTVMSLITKLAEKKQA